MEPLILVIAAMLFVLVALAAAVLWRMSGLARSREETMRGAIRATLLTVEGNPQKPELDKLEATYQLTEDIKAPYSWTARAYMLRSRQQEQYPVLRQSSPD